MSASSTRSTFGALDIAVFVATLLCSAAIGVYFAIKDRRKKNVENYFFGGRKMSPIPIGLSISVTFISAITIIGFPSETYLFGMVTIWYAFTLIMPTVLACIYYIPLIHELRLTTIYELIYMGVTVYLPALALSAVTPISIELSIILTSAICTMYTTVGGLKAVVWTDVLQAIIMLTGAFSVLIQGTIMVGGVENVWKALDRGGRNNMWTLDFNPKLRITFWTVMVGFSTTQIAKTCLDQSVCQRYLSCKSVRDARIASVAALFPKVIITLITVSCGCVMYAYFETCDPIKSGKIAKSDQMMPYLAAEAFTNLPGMTGFFVAAAYSGTLSTVSSGINSLSSMVLADFVLVRWKDMTYTRQLILGKLIALGMGLLVTVIAFIASLSSETIISLAVAARSAFGGPLVGIYFLGMFIPWCNGKGAVAGQVTGFTFALWLGLGGLFIGKDPKTLRFLPTSIGNCTLAENSTFMTTESDLSSTTPMTYESTATRETSEKYYNPVLAMSFFYYTAAGFVVTVFVGVLVSACIGFEKPCESNPKLFSPFIDNPHLPDSVVRFFRFGVPQLIQKDQELEEEVNLQTRKTSSTNFCSSESSAKH